MAGWGGAGADGLASLGARGPTGTHQGAPQGHTKGPSSVCFSIKKRVVKKRVVALLEETMKKSIR